MIQRVKIAFYLKIAKLLGAQHRYRTTTTTTSTRAKKYDFVEVAGTWILFWCVFERLPAKISIIEALASRYVPICVQHSLSYILPIFGCIL